jgi:hypothetical protein
VSDETLEFEASDAWLLLAIIYAAADKDGVSLDQIVGAGDFINHAIFTNDEMESGFYRLTRGGYVEEVDGNFRPTKLALNKYNEISKKKKRAVLGQLDLLRESIGAKPVVFGVSFPRPENEYSYPGLTTEKLAQAVEKYHKRAAEIMEELDKKRRKKR